MKIKLTDILNIQSPKNYKLHLACRNSGSAEPLDIFASDHNEWIRWHEWRGRKNDWTRQKILSFIAFYPKPGYWLFAGAFDVLERKSDRYAIKALPEFEKYAGRLLAKFHRYQGLRGRAFKLESHINNFTISEIFPSVYSGESFPGFENINHSFPKLEVIFKNQRADWKAALTNLKGVYLISDKSNGKKYVGSAYGDAGLWSRWSCYIETGHGWNDELIRLTKEKGNKYARENFNFSILEVMTKTTPDHVVIARESHWKRVLLSREFGYNKN